MTDHYSDYIDFEEVSACCGASIIGLDNGLAIALLVENGQNQQNQKNRGTEP